MNAIYEATVQLLGSDLPTPTLQQSLTEGLSRLGRDEQSVNFRDMEKVLKSSVYRQLQVHLPAAAAKNRIQQVITKLEEFDIPENNPSTTSIQGGLEHQGQTITVLEDALKRFNLYFEWPEVQKFRAQLQVIRSQHSAGKAAADLVKDAQNQLDALERRLEELLVRQARDLAELQADLERVRSIGGPRIKRLQAMITEITQAQTSSTLAPAEVERARKMAIDLRKLVESSVVSAAVDDVIVVDETPTPAPKHNTAEFLLDVEFASDEPEFLLDFTDLSPEQSERVRDIDLKEETRALDGLDVEYRAVLEATPELAQQLSLVRERNQNRELLGPELETLRQTLQDCRAQLLKMQLTRLESILPLLERYAEAGLDTGEAQLTHSVASGMVGAGVLASDDVKTLEDLLRTLERQYEERLRARAEEQARLERLLLRQESILTEMRSAASAFASLGDSSTHSFTSSLAELEAETRARIVREDLSRQMVEEAKTLQLELDKRETEARAEAARRETEARAEAEARANEQRAKLEQAEREAEAQLETERLEAARREAERREQLQRESGALRGMRVGLSSLPDLPELTTKAQALEARFNLAATALENGRSLEEELGALQTALQELASDYSLTFSDVLTEFETQARTQGANDVQTQVQAAREELQSGAYPDLNAIEAALRSHRELRLNAQRRELAELETASREYAILPDAMPLLTVINQARAGHELGEFVQLAEAWDALEALRNAEERRLHDWGTRVDAIALESGNYRRMGGETVRQLERLLNALKTERAVTRIAPETRLRLERNLSEAEALISSAREEHAAASAVAAVLSDSSNLEDLLGFFDAVTPPAPSPDPTLELPPLTQPTVELEAGVEPEAVAAESPEPELVLVEADESEPVESDVVESESAESELVELRLVESGLVEPEHLESEPVEPVAVASGSSVSEALRAWIEHLSTERGVGQVALLRLDGQLEMGQIERPVELARLLSEAERYNQELAQELHRKPARLTTVEFAGGALVAAFLRSDGADRALIVRLDDATAYSRVFSQLLRDHNDLSAWANA